MGSGTIRQRHPDAAASCRIGEAAMRSGIWQGVCVAALMVASGSAWAVDPIGGSKFNISAQIDLFKLNRTNFADMVTPVAKTETGLELVFYDFADNFCDLLAE